MDALNQADTAWLMVSCALVMLMTPGLALFYGGMVGSKNVLSSFMHSFIALGIITLQWVVIGYSLSFGSDAGGGFIGGFEYAFLNGVGLEPQEGSTIPHILFMAFQMMFAIITPALISGAIAERMKFSASFLFIILWATLVYDPICHWVWGPDGWLGARGALDFAGGTVVHLSSGTAALVCAVVIGRRARPGPPHNLTLTLLGAGMLWFGWFGFNAGSALASNENAALDTLATVTSVLPGQLITRLARQQANTIDFATSNVKGSPIPLYIAGAQVIQSYPIGPLIGTAFNLTLMSYQDRLEMGLHIDTASVTEPELLTKYLEGSFAELAKA